MSQLWGKKNTKDEKGVWKTLRGSNVYLTKDVPHTENQEDLGYEGRISYLRKQLLQVFAGSGNISFAVHTMETSAYP